MATLSSELIKADQNLTGATIRLDGILFDITIECSSEDAAHSLLEGLQMSVADAREQTVNTLERTSPTLWKYHGVIGLYRNMGHLAITIQSEEASEVGFLELTKEISEHLDITAVVHSNKRQHKIGTEVGVPSLSIAYTISVDFEEVQQRRSAPFSRLDELPDKTEVQRLSAIDLFHTGTTLAERFEETGSMVDISNAIESLQSAVALLPEDHPLMPSSLANLGMALARRFERAGDLTDITAAIQHFQKSVELGADGHADMPSRLTNLGNSFLRRFERIGDLADISAAIEHFQNAVELTPEGDADMPSRLNDLGNMFLRRFRSVELAPDGHAGLSSWLSNLGRLFLMRFMETKRVGDCQAASLYYCFAATQNTGSPAVRHEAAQRWAYCAFSLENYAEALRAYGVAIELLPLMSNLGQRIHTRHARLLGPSDLTRQAVAVALITGSNNNALEWFERSRCLIWTQINQLRTPIDLLQQRNPRLAQRFLALSTALESSGTTQQFAAEDHVLSQLKRAQEWEQLLTEIRGLANFKDFLRPPQASNILSELPNDGPIVLINLSRTSCDALALIHGLDDPIHIRLNNFTYEDAELLRNQLWYHLTHEKFCIRDSDDRSDGIASRPDTGLRHILRELWNGIVWPIFQGLGYSSTPAHRKRIWWCVTGPLAFLPIHAAGVYDPNAHVSGPCASDFAVSSYIPNVTTLLEKLIDNEFERPETKILLLSQPNALPHAPIPGTITETQAVLRRMKEADIQAVLLEDEEGTKNRVTEALRSHGWVHIASHASQHPTDPLKSGFYFHNGQLELLEIIRQRLPSAEFAYLSACQTSVGDENLSDEVVHLAAGMLAAGYQGVVATMWSIKDQYAPEVAENFYGYLLQDMKDRGIHRLDSRRAAYALDDATRKIRAKLGDSEHSLLTWVPYIHLGL
ncbi:CHAT domain-containing protein [Crepidotus variabilis]|uniref:CHAT domain-containing protein n=1 Tax=Crepidotus variabilis TaxID=179855 RepID=A0A9P6JKF6_9AGAR|nr:CHAT domain-containing protein [Crepidotus variabilis]